MATRGNIGPQPVTRVIPVQLALGGAIGAVVVLGIGAGLGGLIEGLAPPPVLVVTALAGAIFGAFAGGAISHERRSRSPIDGPG